MARSRTHSFLLRWLVVAACAAFALGVSVAGADVASAKTSKPTVKIAKVPGVGSVLVASDGHTLYTLTNNGAAVACTGQCAAAWPPLMANGKPKGAKGVSRLGTMTGGQVTARGLPLYTFAGDANAGTASGEGITSFGGTWHVVKTAKGSTSGTTPSKPATSSSSSSGYGY